jgi:phosphoketolase
MLILRTPKGWTGPKIVDGVQIEGTFRAHQVPLTEVRENPEHLQMLEDWMRNYRPEELFDQTGRLVSELAALATYRRTPDGRESERQRRYSAARSRDARLLRLHRRRRAARRRPRRGNARARNVPARRDEEEPRPLSLLGLFEPMFDLYFRWTRPAGRT